jgi:hypothetical protein
MILTETVGYYEEFDLPIVDDAFVTITYQGVTDTLDYLSIAASGTDTISFYFAPRTVEINDPNAPFDLYIRDNTGREVTAQTFVPAVVPIDTFEWEFNDRDEAFLTMDFNDPQDQTNYYRVVFLRRELTLIGDPINSTLDSAWIDRLQVAFAFDDEFAEDDGSITVGTGFNYAQGDSITIFLYQISKEHYDFLETVDAAETANFSPFAQPTRIQTNIEGGMGIFTGYNYDKRFFVIER